MIESRGVRQIFYAFLLLVFLLSRAMPASAVDIGAAAPEIALISLSNGQEVQLSQLRGTVVYVDFWASWCGPCRISLPALDRIYEELKGLGFEILAVNVDEQQRDALSFLKDYPVSYPVLWDPTGDTPSRYQVPGMPTAFLIDRNGRVRDVHMGFRKSDSEKVRSRILELLGE
jgi:thiol-disulfide isomerase/thioredoxin